MILFVFLGGKIGVYFVFFVILNKWIVQYLFILSDLVCFDFNLISSQINICCSNDTDVLESVSYLEISFIYEPSSVMGLNIFSTDTSDKIEDD